MPTTRESGKEPLPDQLLLLWCTIPQNPVSTRDLPLHSAWVEQPPWSCCHSSIHRIQSRISQSGNRQTTAWVKFDIMLPCQSIDILVLYCPASCLGDSTGTTDSIAAGGELHVLGVLKETNFVSLCYRNGETAACAAPGVIHGRPELWPW